MAAIACFPENFLSTSDSAAAAFCGDARAFECFAFLPVVDARAVFTEDEIFPFADEIFMLRCQHDVASAAGAVFNRYDDPVFFIAQKSLVNLEDFRSASAAKRSRCSFRVALLH